MDIPGKKPANAFPTFSYRVVLLKISENENKKIITSHRESIAQYSEPCKTTDWALSVGNIKTSSNSLKRKVNHMM